MSTRNIKLDTRPLYARAVDALVELTTDGGYPPGQMLPSEEELARQLGVSRSTLREAISHLEKDGLITRRQGVGTFVAKRSAQPLSGGLEWLQSFRTLADLAGLTARPLERNVTTSQASTEESGALGVPEGAELVRVQVVESIGDCRIAFLDGVMSRHLVDPEELATSGGSLLDYLVERADLEPEFARSHLFALDADGELAGQLHIPQGKSVLHLAETLYSHADQPIAYLRNYFLTECFNFTIFRRVVLPRGRKQPGTPAP